MGRGAITTAAMHLSSAAARSRTLHGRGEFGNSEPKRAAKQSEHARMVSIDMLGVLRTASKTCPKSYISHTKCYIHKCVQVAIIVESTIIDKSAMRRHNFFRAAGDVLQFTEPRRKACSNELYSYRIGAGRRENKAMGKACEYQHLFPAVLPNQALHLMSNA